MPTFLSIFITNHSFPVIQTCIFCVIFFLFFFWNQETQYWSLKKSVQQDITFLDAPSFDILTTATHKFAVTIILLKYLHTP